MKDPRSVLRQKDLDLVRVRKEIQALLTVIPLLVDDPPFSDVMNEVPLASFPTHVDPPENDMAQLELYYPFVRHLGMSNPKRGDRPLGGIGPQTPQSSTPKTGQMPFPHPKCRTISGYVTTRRLAFITSVTPL